MIAYVDSVEGVSEEHLRGFFVGWPVPPSPSRHLELLRSSYAVELALDDEMVVGFVTAISDGVMSASIPLLEVLPDYQGNGIGTELMRRMLARLDDLYMIDVSCDARLEGFYARLGFAVLDRGMGIRRPQVLHPNDQAI